MSMNAQAYDQYKRATVETVSPEKLLLMLYDGAIKDIRNARQAIRNSDIELAHQQIVKAEEIILELMATLKMEYEIAHSLFALYEYLYRQLVQANFKKDIALLDEVEGFLVELRDTWVEAAKKLKTGGDQSMPMETTAPQTISTPGKVAVTPVSPQRSGLNIQG